MIQFNNLKITQDGKYIIINASVKDLDYYNDVLIGSITIDNQDTYSASGPSSNPIYYKSFATTDLISNKSIIGIKDISLVIPVSEIADDNNNLNDDILYIYLSAVGTPAPNTPCGMDNVHSLGVTVNLRPIYYQGMSYIKQLESNCSIPKAFIDFILKYNALDLCLKTSNYIQANKYWNKFFRNVLPLNPKSCGCS